MGSRIRTAAKTLILAALTATVSAPAAGAAFPGTNGNVLFNGFPPPGIGEIYTMGSDGQNVLPLTSSPQEKFSPTYSADGERIAFTQTTVGGEDHIWVMNADGSGQTELTNHDLDRDPSFFPDGRIAFAGIPTTPDHFEIWVMNPDGSGQQQLTNEPFGTEDPVVSPDGTRIAFVETSDIYVMNADGSGVTNVTNNSAISEEGPNWSPDGRQLVFTRPIAGDDEVVVMDADGGNQIQLTENGVDERFPAFSPDGTRIVYQVSGGGGIWVMDANGQNQAQLFNAIPAGDPDWQPLNPPLLDVTAGKQKSPKTVTVTVVSQNENATATLDGTLRAAKPKPKAAASKKKTVELDAVTVALQAGVPATIEIPVAGKGKKLIRKSLKAGKRPKGTIAATATDDLGSAATDATDVKYKKKRKKK